MPAATLPRCSPSRRRAPPPPSTRISRPPACPTPSPPLPCPPPPARPGPLGLAVRPGQAVESIRIGGGPVAGVGGAFDAIKYQEASPRPHLEIRVPTVADPSLAPAGHRGVSILASYAPHDVAGGWTEKPRADFLEPVLATLERHAPGAPGPTVAQERQ